MTSGFVFHHTGVGTLDFEAAIRAYAELGYRLTAHCDDPGLNIRAAFLEQDGQPGGRIEILAPLGADGPLAPLIRRKFLPSPYHTCFATDDLAAAHDRLRIRGFLPVSEVKPALLMGGACVQFFYHAAAGLIEIVETSGS